MNVCKTRDKGVHSDKINFHLLSKPPHIFYAGFKISLSHMFRISNELCHLLNLIARVTFSNSDFLFFYFCALKRFLERKKWRLFFPFYLGHYIRKMSMVILVKDGWFKENTSYQTTSALPSFVRRLLSPVCGLPSCTEADKKTLQRAAETTQKTAGCRVSSSENPYSSSFSDQQAERFASLPVWTAAEALGDVEMFF